MLGRMSNIDGSRVAAQGLRRALAGVGSPILTFLLARAYPFSNPRNLHQREAAMHTGIAALRLACLLTAAVVASSVAQEPRTDGGATVAILYFTNSSLVRHDDYEPLSKGITEMLITELSANDAIQVVERDRLQQLIEEQDLNATDRVNQETAVRLGKMLGAHHMLMGGFVIDPKETMRLDVRSVNVETSRVEYVENVSGKVEDVLDLIAQLGREVNDGLRFPPLPARNRDATTREDPPVPPGGRGGEVEGPKPSRDEPEEKLTASKASQLRAVMLLSRALNEEDRGNVKGAVDLYNQALDVHPQFERAKVLLASAEARLGS